MLLCIFFSIMNSSFLKRLVYSISFSATMLASTPSFAQEKPPAEIFFQNASINQVTMSPDGKTLGMLVATKIGRVQLATLDLATKQARVVGGFANADIGEFHWVNSDRLVFSTSDKQKAQGEQRYFPGLFAINKDGSDARTLIERIWFPDSTAVSSIKTKTLSGFHSFLEVDDSPGSESVFVTEPVFNAVYDIEAQKLKRVNTKTGEVETFSRPGKSYTWMIDHHGQPRITVTQDAGIEQIWYRDPKLNQWKVIAESKFFGGDNFEPFDFGVDGSLYVLDRQNTDKTALYRFDLEKNAIDPTPVVAIDGYDFSGSLVGDLAKGKITGIRYQNDAYTTLWLDPQMKKVQAAVDALLPATINQISIPRLGLAKTVLVRAYSDVQPSLYLIFNIETNQLELIGSAMPAIDATKMAMQDMIRYKAKDGLEIPAYLTLPQGGKKNLPMIVLVHGGPYVRGASWGWDAQVQFLASRGYAVLQPEFRGSTGFGFKHFQAGWKQWGLAMQEDIADGARWAIAQGIADPKRICIAGASYGGYATLMGLAKNPELFQCGVNWVGVTDMNLMYQSNWTNDSSELWQKYGMPMMVGDPVADAKQLTETSPVELADKIKQPVLLAYGAVDRRVPIEHGRSFYAKAKKTNSNVEWIQYNEEGHGWALPQTRVDFWTKVEKFLEKSIGK